MDWFGQNLIYYPLQAWTTSTIGDDVPTRGKEPNGRDDDGLPVHLINVALLLLEMIVVELALVATIHWLLASRWCPVTASGAILPTCRLTKEGPCRIVFVTYSQS